MLKWAQRVALKKYLKHRVHKEVDKTMGKLLKEIDNGLAKVPGNGKKTLVSALATSALTLLPIVEHLATDPNFHAVVASIVQIVPSWGVYVTLGGTVFGLIHKVIKILAK
jgi:hypothetical protein